MIHDLKIYPHHFQRILDGVKAFEIRSIADRVFEEGDVLRLREYEPAEFGFSDYTGREVSVRVTLVHSGLGMQPGFVCMSIEPVHQPRNAIRETGPVLMPTPSEWAARDLVAERIVPKPAWTFQGIVTRALNLHPSTATCDIVAEIERLKWLASKPRNEGIPAHRKHEFVIREDGSVVHVENVPEDTGICWTLGCAAQILVAREKEKKGGAA